MRTAVIITVKIGHAPALFPRLRRFGQPVVPTAPDESSRRRSFGSADVGVEESPRLAVP
jgi:hypothetical protein